jgi:hypothetical protein
MLIWLKKSTVLTYAKVSLPHRKTFCRSKTQHKGKNAWAALELHTQATHSLQAIPQDPHSQEAPRSCARVGSVLKGLWALLKPAKITSAQGCLLRGLCVLIAAAGTRNKDVSWRVEQTLQPRRTVRELLTPRAKIFWA